MSAAGPALFVVAVFVIALFVGALVTDAISLNGWWAQRLGRSRWRRANLPVGGVVFVIVALLTPGQTSAIAAVVAVAFTFAAVGWRFIEPPPPYKQPPRERGW